MKKLLLLCVSLSVSSTLWAASQMTQVLSTYGGNGFFNWEYKETYAYGKGRSRVDNEYNRLFHSTPELRSHIERLDLDKRWSLDPKHKRYTEESISEAQARLKKEMEKSQAEWAKRDQKETKPEAEDSIRIKSAKTTTTGPGAVVTINGYACQPYVVKTVIEYESTKDSKPAGSQTLYAKEWVTEANALAAYHHDQEAFWLSMGKQELKDPQFIQFQQSMKAEVEKAQKDSATNPWLSFMNAVGKIKGHSVRSLTVFSFPTAEKSAAPAPDSASKDDDVLQPGDLSGGVGGMMSGMATRWASKKVEKKVQAKMAEHPAWVDDVSKDLDGALIGWGYMREVQSVKNDVPSEVFEVPSGYKKVKSL